MKSKSGKTSVSIHHYHIAAGEMPVFDTYEFQKYYLYLLDKDGIFYLSKPEGFRITVPCHPCPITVRTDEIVYPKIEDFERMITCYTDKGELGMLGMKRKK